MKPVEKIQKLMGEVVRNRRRALGLTLAQVVPRVGLSLGYLSQLELGRQSPSLESLYRLCAGLGLSIGELMPPVEQWDADNDLPARVERIRVQALGKLTAEEKEALGLEVKPA